MRHVGDYLKLYLEQSKISIYQAAKRSGINRTTLQKVLSGDRNPSKSMILALIPVLNLSDQDFSCYGKHLKSGNMVMRNT